MNIKSELRSPDAQCPGPLNKRFTISSRVIPSLMVGLDSLVVLLSALTTYASIVGDVDEPANYGAAIAFVWLVSSMLLHFAGLYQFELIMRPLAYWDKILIAFATTFLFLLAAAFALKISTDYSRLWIGSFAILACAGTMLSRLLASLILGRLADKRVFSRDVIIIGAGEQAHKLLNYIAKSQPRFISVLGVFADNGELNESIAGYPVLGNIDEVSSFIRSRNVDDIVIALPWSADAKIAALTNKLRELPVNVYLGADLIGFRLPLRPPPAHFGEMPLVELMGRPLAGWGWIQKAILDYGIGIILTVLLLPLMIVTMLAIRLESRGPAIFRQQRYGFVNRIFEIYKFRTMRYEVAREEKVVQATRDDPKVTRIGRFLRRASLDELPQLFNVLNGTMSLVGPRPHAVEHNEEYARLIRGYFARHRVKPGMTGWAQVNGFRGETKSLEAMEDRVKHDIYYVENWSLLLDLKILVMTAFICLTGRNAY